MKTPVQNARELRQEMTETESFFWKHVRGKKMKNAKIRRQHPVGSWVLDFYWAEKKLAIEIDGGIHLKPEVQENDETRTAELDRLGIRVIRFTNDEVMNDLGSVIRWIILFAE